jgi:hypothetical protein
MPSYLVIQCHAEDIEQKLINVSSTENFGVLTLGQQVKKISIRENNN